MSANRYFWIVALIAAFAGPLAAGAQTPPPPPPPPDASASPMAGTHHGRRHHKPLLHALRAVDLTDAQKQQIATFRDQAQKANVNADPATKKANGAKMRQQIMGILTPDQKAQLSAEMHRQNGPKASSSPLPAASPMASPGTK